MIANHKGEVPFVILILPFLLGLGVGLNFLSAAYILPLTILFFALCLAFIALNLTYKKFNIYKFRWLGGALVNLILFVFGCTSIVRYSELNKAHHFSKTAAKCLLVNISNEPVLKNGLLRFTARVEENIDSGKKSPASGTLLITLKDSLAKNLFYGDELLIPANYTAIDPPFNPAEFDYKSYLAHQNIYYQSFLYHGQYVVLGHNTGNALVAFSLRLRQQLVQKLKANMHNADAIAVASALILGYKADLSSDVVSTYVKAGAIHILTISGMQVAIIYLLLGIVFSFLNPYKYGRVVKAILIIAFIWYYALLTGFAPAVCRAALMVSMVIIGKTYNRYLNSLNLLAISAFILLLCDPFYIADVGFQLSFLAISGLIIWRPIVYNLLKFKNRWADKLWDLCALSIAAQAVIFPLSMFYFHQFPVYFLLSNLLVVIPVTIIIYTGALYLLLPQIAIVSKTLGYILENTITLMDKALAAIEHAPYASINKLWINPAEYLLLYILIISLFYFLYDRKAWPLKLGLFCVLLLSMSFGYKKISALHTHTIAFLNMRKHTGIILKNGDKAIVISDLSDTDKNYKYSIQPYLDSCKVSEVSLYTADGDIRSSYLVKKGNLIQFEDKKILLYNKQINTISLNKKLNIDYLYVTGSPYTDIKSINKNFAYKMLVIDGSNSNRLVNNLQQQAKLANVNYKVLKRNNSVVIVSN
jgi:competence protein ComEC